MPDDQPLPRISPFDRIRHASDDGGEYWSARELSKLLGYTEYGKFARTIEKAETACKTSERTVADHFAHVSDMIETGKGAKREVEDVHLSRYACYLIVQNADPAKPIVALGQTYFAVRTREAEVAQDELAGLSEAQRRLFLRGEVADANVELAAAAYGVGVLTSRDFGIFQDHGYMGLYGGERARDIAARKGLKKGQPILDHMGSEELAGNWFRATQAEAKLSRERETIAGKDEANAIHHAVGREVRETIQRLGGTPPEQLPTPPHSIKELQKLEQRRIEGERQPSLFDDPGEDASD